MLPVELLYKIFIYVDDVYLTLDVLGFIHYIKHVQSKLKNKITRKGVTCKMCNGFRKFYHGDMCCLLCGNFLTCTCCFAGFATRTCHVCNKACCHTPCSSFAMRRDDISPPYFEYECVECQRKSGSEYIFVTGLPYEENVDVIARLENLNSYMQI